MNAALLYRPSQQWRIWAAFACAAGLHFAAFALARNTTEVSSFSLATDDGVEVFVDRMPDIAPPQPIPPEEIVPPPPAKLDEAFPDDKTPPVERKVVPYHPVRPAMQSGLSGRNLSAVKVLATYAPRPEYPYEARRQHAIGSGILVLTIDPASGGVTEARITQSTGSTVLDNSAMSAFRRWRFKPGTIVSVKVPITFTLSGASY